MKKLLLLASMLFPLLAFGQSQGTAIRALNGYGSNTLFFNSLGFPIRETADMAVGFLFNFQTGNLSIDWGARKLWDGSQPTLDYLNRKTFDMFGVASIDWGNRIFLNTPGTNWTFLSITNHNDVSAGAFLSGNVWGYNGLTATWTNGPPGWVPLGTLKTNVILTANISNGGLVIPTGTVQGFRSSGDSYTVSGWAISCMGTSPTISCDIWNIAPGGTALPTVANTIVGAGQKPSLSVGNVTNSTTLTSWTSTAILKGSTWGVDVTACSAATNAVIQIYGYRSQ